MVNLTQKRVGFEGLISGYAGDAHFLERLIDLGMTCGEPIRIESRTLFGDFVVSARGAKFALRKEEAQCILV